MLREEASYAAPLFVRVRHCFREIFLFHWSGFPVVSASLARHYAESHTRAYVTMPPFRQQSFRDIVFHMADGRGHLPAAPPTRTGLRHEIGRYRVSAQYAIAGIYALG